jgi:hypothetical protein
MGSSFTKMRKHIVSMGLCRCVDANAVIAFVCTRSLSKSQEKHDRKLYTL